MPNRKRLDDAVADLDGPSCCACFNLRKATRAVTQLYDAALAPSGLTATQFSILQLATTAGPLSMTALARRLVMDRTTLTRNLRPLVACRLVVVARDPVDRRSRRVAPTARGRRALAEALPLWRGAQRNFIAALGEPAMRSLLRGLDAAVEAVRDTAP